MNSSPSRLVRFVAVAIPIFGICIALVCVEVGYRILRSRAQPVRWSDRPRVFVMPTDSVSLQEREAGPKAPGVFRIAVVGDSFTFGPHLQYEDTFPKRLERSLNIAGGTPRIEVLNRGFSGYSTVREVEPVQQAVRDGADLVVLQITLNDAEPHTLAGEERRQIFDPPYLHSRILQIWSSLGFALSRLHNNVSRKEYIKYHSKFWEQPESFAQFDGALQKMVEATASRSVPLVAVVFPLFDFPLDASYPFEHIHDVINGALDTRGISHVDLRKLYTNIPFERLQVIPGGDSHPNEIAHRMAAEKLMSFLIVSGLVPDSAIPQRLFRDRVHIQSPSVAADKVWRRKGGEPVVNQPNAQSSSQPRRESSPPAR